MRCIFCGNIITLEDNCPYCGNDVSLYKRIVYLSNRLYNDGLKKASVRDLSGASESLKRSLEFNKRNTDARNLLGLVYFEMGEIADALAEWILSRQYDSSPDNLAVKYIGMVQSNQSRLSTIGQTIRKYNQALSYSYQGSYDLAIIQLKKVLSINDRLIKAYQLLGLLYYRTEDYEKARRTFIRALRIDSGNTKLLYYLKETDDILHEIDIQSQDGKKKNVRTPRDLYYDGSDVVIPPVVEKEKIGFSSIINVLVGIVVGVAICYFLILPSRLELKTAEFDAKYIEISDQLAEEQALHSQDVASLDAVTKERDKLKSDLSFADGSSGKMRPEDYIIEAADAYVNNSDDSQKVMGILDNLTEDDLNSKPESFKNLYSVLMGESGPKVIAAYLESASNAMKSNSYEEAISYYEKAYALNTGDSDVLMHLAHAYRQNGDIEKANELYRKISTDFPDTQNAADALEYITEE